MNRRKWFLFFLLVFIVSLSARIFYSVSIKGKGEEYNRIAVEYASSAVGQGDEAVVNQTENGEPAAGSFGDRGSAALETISNTDQARERKEEKVIDFEELWERNPDIYAWISIPGTGINYPVVQSSDDDAYYLNHTVDRERGLPGSIYTEQLNGKDFADMNTVIYGHNMKDGSMFAGLHQYKDGEFMMDNQLLHIYTPEKKYTYQIFAGVTYNDNHLLKAFDFDDMVSYQEFLDSLNQVRTLESYVDRKVKLTRKTRLITLSTCTKSDHQRFLVVAKLINDD